MRVDVWVGARVCGCVGVRVCVCEGVRVCGCERVSFNSLVFFPVNLISI